MTINDQIPFLLTGVKAIKRQAAMDTVLGYKINRAEDVIKNIEDLYKSAFNEELNEYQGLLVFCEIVKFLKQIEYPVTVVTHMILLAQKRVLHYHHLQYEREKSGVAPEGDDK